MTLDLSVAVVSSYRVIWTGCKALEPLVALPTLLYLAAIEAFGYKSVSLQVVLRISSTVIAEKELSNQGSVIPPEFGNSHIFSSSNAATVSRTSFPIGSRTGREIGRNSDCGRDRSGLTGFSLQ